MKKVLVTGASGFLGFPCVSALIRYGHEVHAADQSSPPKDAPGEVRWHRLDLLDERSVKRLMDSVRPSHLLHMAWYVKPGEFWTSPENERWRDGSLRLIERFIEAGGRRMVAAGTCAEYDWTTTGPFRETTTRISPATPYGICKHELHEKAEALARQQGVEMAWGRLFFLYGPREKPQRMVASMIRSLQAGRETICRQGNLARDFIHVHDAAEAFVALLDGKVTGPVNIASGQCVSLGRVATLISETLDRSNLLVVHNVPPDPDRPLRIEADTGRLNKEVGFSPQYDIVSGIQDTVKWRQAHPDN